MRKVLLSFAFLLVLVAVSCGEKKPSIDEGREAAKAAKTYYTALARGKYDDFLRVELRSGRLPDGYRQGLINNLQQFVAKCKKDHTGIDSISIASATFSGKDSVASAFLILHFSDSTSDQIVVPMVKKRGKWWLR